MFTQGGPRSVNWSSSSWAACGNAPFLRCRLVQGADDTVQGPESIHVINCCSSPHCLVLLVQEDCFYFSPKCKENSLSRNLGVEKWWWQVGRDKLFTVPEHRENKEIIYLLSSLWRKADCGPSTDAKSVFIPGCWLLYMVNYVSSSIKGWHLVCVGALCFPHSYSIVCCRQMHVFNLWERSNYVLFYKLSLTRKISPHKPPSWETLSQGSAKRGAQKQAHTWSHHWLADYCFSLKASDVSNF